MSLLLVRKSLLLPIAATVIGITGCQSMSASTADQHPKTTTSTAAHELMQTHSHYADNRTMHIGAAAYPIAETSARLLWNAEQNTPELVDDIFAGAQSTPVAGYKIMIINRSSSVAAEARTLSDGRVIDNRMIHRGSKALIGIPVVAGQPRLDKAQLLSFDVIQDDPTQNLTSDATFKPRGKKLTKRDSTVTDQQVIIRALTLPNVASGERAGGGIDFEARAVVDGQQVTTSANSAFTVFDIATPDKARGF